MKSKFFVLCFVISMTQSLINESDEFEVKKLNDASESKEENT